VLHSRIHESQKEQENLLLFLNPDFTLEIRPFQLSGNLQAYQAELTTLGYNQSKFHAEKSDDFQDR